MKRLPLPALTALTGIGLFTASSETVVAQAVAP